MQIKNTIFQLFIIISMIACSEVPGGGELEARSPYGIWTTKIGHVVVITRDDKYVYCSKAKCMNGHIRKEGAFGVYLEGFVTNDVTKDLQHASGRDRFMHIENYALPDLDFTEMGLGMSRELRKERCNDQPCVPIGNLDDKYILYNFIKVEDF